MVATHRGQYTPKTSRTIVIAWCLLGVSAIGMVFAWGRLHNSSALHAPSLPSQLKPEKLRGPMPPLHGETLAGPPINNGSFAGRPAVIDFFATTCGPCRDEATEIGKLAARFAGRVHFVGVDVEDASKATTRRFARDHGWRFPIVWDPSGHLVIPFRVGGTPSMVFVDSRGRLALLVPGPHSEAEYTAAIDKLIRT